MKNVFKHLSFVTPELRKNNIIVKNINSGLNKNGKVLKHQSRTAEILNYTFQLMARSIGQMWKNLLSSLNPLTQIKKLFQDFTSYDVKFQRTMNVVKYNLRAIVKPMMEWIAQQLVNIIGFFDIILMKIQEAFGKTPISLFDKSAADAEKMKEELEEAANATASFDELHDISGETSSGSDAAMDFTGEIYTPQLSDDWKKLAEDIGDLFKNIITGDLGFGDVMKKALEIVGEGLKLIGETIWGWLKDLGIVDWLKKNWAELLATLLAAFVGWQLLKIAGKLLWNAFFGEFTAGAIGNLFTKLGTWLSSQFLWVSSGGTAGQLFWTTFAGKIIQGVAGLASVLTAVATIKIAFDFGTEEGKQTAWGEQSDLEGTLQSALGGAGIGLVGGAITGGLAILAGAATTAFLPIVAALTVIASVASLIGYNVSKANEEFKIQQGLLMDSEYYALKLTDANNVLELQEVRTAAQQERYNNALDAAREIFETLTPAMQTEYGGSLEKLIEKTDYGATMTGDLTAAEQALKDQLILVKSEMDELTVANEKLAETKKKILELETLSQIAADVEAEKYELAAARIELAVEQGVLTVEQGSRLMQGAFAEASKAERDSMLANMEPELRAKFLAYLATTKEFRDEYITYYQEANDEVKKAFEDPSVTAAAEAAGVENAEALLNGLKKANLGDKIAAWWRDILPGGETGEDYYRRKGITTSSSSSSSSARTISVASFAVGTNYVPNDGLAYLHQGEAVIPKQYNTSAYTPDNSASVAIASMTTEISKLREILDQGIDVKGEFRQRGSDLVAVVEKGKNKNGNQALSNPVYAR